MTPGEFFLFTSIYNKKNIKKNDLFHDFFVINAYLNRVFNNKEEIDIKDFLINKFETKKERINKKGKYIKMSDEEIFDGIKKLHIAFGGKAVDFKNIKIPNKN